MTDMIGNFTTFLVMDNFQEKMRRGKAVTACEGLLGAVDAATCGDESVGNPLVHRFDGNFGCSVHRHLALGEIDHPQFRHYQCRASTARTREVSKPPTTSFSKRRASEHSSEPFSQIKYRKFSRMRSR